jgi:hypothetical protein
MCVMGDGAPQIEWHHDGLSRPLANPRLRVLSLGAGVQSTTLALMAARGDLVPMPDCAIFADTQSEPAAVYKHLAWLESVLPYPVIRVTSGNLETDILNGQNTTSHDWCAIPAFVENEAGETAILRRQCTQEYKLHAIVAEVRRQIGLKPRQSIRHFLRLKRAEPTPPLVEMCIGISTDEIERLTQSRHAYIHARHPLVEARMSRLACERWLTERQYRIPGKSACRFCPFRTDAEWLDMKVNAPIDFAGAVAVDRAIRHGNPFVGMRTSRMALHRSLRPLEEIDFTIPDPTAGRFDFKNECLGMCGV